ncbi:MAG TPA: hypothetical protein VMM56_14510 [Planctomycetaceae bacterium]|nr:hypothetical protein [Planctomycetaceae bacterium]
MATIEDADQDVPEQAVKALAEAHAEAIRRGYPLVFVEGDKLVERLTDGTIVIIKDLPERLKVSPGTRKVKS